MNKNLKIALIVIMALILVITVVVFLVVFFSAERKDETNINGETNVNTVIDTNATTNQAVDTNSATINTNTNSTSAGSTNVEPFLQPIARNFAERFGSYSNHSDYENITKLEVYMSNSMKNWARKYVAEQQANDSIDADYYGITTKALSVATDSINEDGGTAQFTVSTQRNETKGDEEAKIIYRDIVIKFILESGEWKVNEAMWL
ncbi:hypothetical protein KKB10_05820 [Patescibacteria group bacterium]|nr:hypothetical protein [Patescibacteria group bacterium]MBU1075580.1 hypothetical protein [Patescibacteria group bacterium]MBU1951859.1 hypothetical protein [Patescibacteria group bacterium]MBU2228924.1 hypothetical protein [Patescibacteria group bacterium]MBU2235902.1 hypothetical protein [Patescibacteria group bacterium]